MSSPPEIRCRASQMPLPGKTPPAPRRPEAQPHHTTLPTRVLIPSGVLGLGFERDALRRGLARAPHAIVIDGGSTDSGPFYLGAGVSKYSRASTKAEWRALMEARAEAGVPLVIGSAGTCGADAMVDWMVAITDEVAGELGQRVRVATVRSSQSPDAIAAAFDAGRLVALPDAPKIGRGDIESCRHIVALAGAEPFREALATGADIVIAGRATDTAGIAALPLMNGEHPGAAWHGAKVAECGALCSTRPMSGVVLVTVDESGFTVEPQAVGARCTPHSVSAHMLYENADPFVLTEPGGALDVTHARYRPIDDRSVRVTGSEWLPSDRYTVKLEGAGLAGFQTTALVLLRNRRYVENAGRWVERLGRFLADEIPARTGVAARDFALDFRIIGRDAALGVLETRTGDANEVGILCMVTADTQETAHEIAKLANPFLLHFPLTDDEELPTFAFPYSPAETDRGPLYEFRLNHALVLDDPMSAFTLDTLELGGDAPR